MEEIQKLLDEDASLYERGGTASGTQSGEEYRSGFAGVPAKTRGLYSRIYDHTEEAELGFA